jgi:hypothetical protein
MVSMSRTLPKYRGTHNWIERQLGKPQKCENCGITEDRRYHWANISGEYKRELDDWKRLCPPCHSKFDSSGVCKQGHPLTGDNAFIRPNGRTRCRTCRDTYNAEYRLKTKERNR